MISINKKSAFLFLITCAVYFNTLWNGYSFDDNFIENFQVKSSGLTAVKEIFTSHYWQEKQNTFGYRPLARFTYYVESQFFSKNPAISHLINILLYAITVLLLFNILKKLFPKNETLTWWISLLFALHPIHTEVVASLKNREEIFMLLFGLSSIWMALRYVEQVKTRYLFFSIIFIWFSLLSKENGVVFSLLIPVSILVYINFDIKMLTNKFSLSIYFLSLILSSWIFYKLPGWILTPEDKILFPFENPLYENNSKINRLLLSAESLGFYFWKLLFPFPLLYYYGYNMLDIPQSITFHILLSLFALIASIILLTRKKRCPILIFSILWFWIALLPFSNYFIPINGIVAERLTFTASIGFIATLTFLLFQFKKISSYLLIGISFVFSIITINRNQEWKSVESLLRADMPYIENSAKANASFATFLLNKTNTKAQNNFQINITTIDSIIFHYKKAIEIYPNYYAAMNNLGLVYFSYKKNDTLANYWLNKALAINPSYSEAAYNLSKVKLRQKDTLGSIHLLKKALQHDSSNIFVLNDLVNQYLFLNKKDTAIFYNKKILLVDSNSDKPYINFGNFALLEKDTARAVKQWEIAIQKNPSNLPLIYGLSRYFRQNKNEKKALYYENLMFQQQRKQFNHSTP